MTLRSVFQWTLCVVLLLLQTVPTRAFETDQYNLPTEPLADIGDEVSFYVERNLRDAVDKVNERLRKNLDCLETAERGHSCGKPEEIRREIEYLRSEDAIAKETFDRVGNGIIPFTKISLWLDTHHFNSQPARYRTSFIKSIHFTAPFNYLTISPTIHMYGEEFGTDKIAHLFQQGYDYYRIYRRALSEGASEESAIAKAVKFGQKTERTYFGTWVSGIFSNADLAANYAGLKFYSGLTREIEPGTAATPPLHLENGFWAFSEKKDPNDYFLKHLITRHFNEAYNPSKFFNLAGFRTIVRRKVRKDSCRQWFERDPNLSKTDLEAQTKSLELWFGEDYGFSKSEHFITIANTCFDEKGGRSG